MDVFDQAQRLDEIYRQSALNRHFAGMQHSQTLAAHTSEGVDGLHLHRAGPSTPPTCCDCGEEIEAARLEAVPSAVRCVSCQEKHEGKGRGR